MKRLWYNFMWNKNRIYITELLFLKKAKNRDIKEFMERNGLFMKVLMFNGSPKAKGCTNTALEEMAMVLNEEGIDTEIMHIGAQPQGSCMGCGGCSETGECIYGGAVVEAAKKLQEADGVVFGSPVHYASVSGNLMGFMHRLSWSAGKYLKYKPAAMVVSARRAGTTSALDEIAKIPEFHHMPLINGNYWPMVHGSTPEDVKKDEEGLQIVRNIARNMAWILKCIELGKKNGMEHPEPETPVRTNFIR